MEKTLKANMLFVEDELDWQDTETPPRILVLLHENGIDYDIAETGKQALIKLRKNKYDVILLDIMLPPDGNNEKEDVELNDDTKKDIKELQNISRVNMGIFLLERLRQGAFEPGGTERDTPVIVLSGVSDTGQERREKISSLLKKNGSNITKPAAPSEIMKVILKTLEAESK